MGILCNVLYIYLRNWNKLKCTASHVQKTVCHDIILSSIQYKYTCNSKRDPPCWSCPISKDLLQEWSVGSQYVHNTRALFAVVITRTHTGSCWPWKGSLGTNRWCGLEGHAGSCWPWKGSLDTNRWCGLEGHAGSCWPWKGSLDTNRCGRLEAPIAWGSTWDTLMSSLWKFW
jgi:hypothetical protein